RFKKHFLNQLKSKLVFALIIIAVISFIVSVIYTEKDIFSPVLIVAIVLINALINAWHLYRCDDALNSLKSITNPSATVIRDGITRQIPSAELVPGDIILLNEGDYITADARIIEANNFRCNESIISGENIPVDKRGNAVFEEITPINERLNMVYSGCSVVHGNCKAVVVETGLNTELGHTSALVQQTGADSIPIKATLDSTEKLANIAIIVICILTFIIGMIQNFSTETAFANLTVKLIFNSVALAVAALPEGLPAISTVVVALGIQRIIKNEIVIKKVKALEVLGKTTVICSDKTGIITHNHMTLDRIFDGEKFIDVNDEPFDDKSAWLLRLAVSCSTLNNDSTENSIIEACEKYTNLKKDDIDNLFPRLEYIPFDNTRKTMTSINMINGRPVAIVKGAPEMLADKFNNISAEEVLNANEKMASDALRVICIALKPLENFITNPNYEDIECNLTFAGLIGLSDPPRKETIDGISVCDTAGIRTIMITGDNIITAKAVARRIGILKDGTEAISGAELSKLSDEELADNVKKYTVYARVTPSDKLRIIEAWKKNGDIVTITGDDITDTDALSAADIGCAMNIQGADVA
ncbi:MAG: HAD-IC family P-type ATPase, partial [Clostridia bacterium]|nr:HAD-IC family P-type ATPase [Clostridia bacterium]